MVTWKDFGCGYNGIKYNEQYETTLTTGQEVLVSGYGLADVNKGFDIPRQQESVVVSTQPNMLIIGLVCVAIVAIVAIVALNRRCEHGEHK
jgi:hypothetical protein